MPLRSNLRIVHRTDSPEELMIRANTFLSQGQAEEAVKLYTQILYKELHGHVCALLNRSLAYICLHLPELAVTDAYRAGIAIQEMRENARGGSERGSANCKYLRAERLESESGAEWVSKRRRYIGTGWASSPLASIVINDVPAPEIPRGVKIAPFNPNKRKEVCDAFEIRSVYRLCGALFLCGDGARNEALGLIDDAITSYTSMELWEMHEFRALGNAVLDKIVLEAEKEDNSDPQGLSSLFNSTQQDIKRTLKESMKARTTSIKLEGYPWDSWEPELQNRDWQTLLRSWVSKCTSNCSPRVMGTLDVYDGTSKPHVELFAARDIAPGEIVLNEQTNSNVTTSIPEAIFEEKTMFIEEGHYYCDTCASLLIVPGPCPIAYGGSTVPLSPENNWEETFSSIMDVSEGDTRASRDSDSDKFSEKPAHSSSPSPGPEITTINPALLYRSPSSQSQWEEIQPERNTSLTSLTTEPAYSPPPPYIPPTNHHHPTPTPPPVVPDFMLCCPTHKVPTCSASCRKQREVFDRGLCHTSIERSLRTSHLHLSTRPKPTSARKTDCLRSLLMLRTLTTAFNQHTHPLHNSDIVFATCGPNLSAQKEEDGEAKPQEWSFTDNVVTPIHHLHQYFAASDIDPFAHLDKTDGWMLNTLFSKTTTAMRVSLAPRYVKIFNDDGVLESAFSSSNNTRRNDLNGRQNRDNEEEEEEEGVWVGSITPTFDMIRVADPGRGEVANVVVGWKEGVWVRAVGSGGVEGGVAVRAGGPLVRAGDWGGDDEMDVDV